MNRKEIVLKIIEEQQKVILNLTSSVDRYKIASDLDEESTHDPEDFSQQTQAKDMQLRYEKMLRDAEYDLKMLEKEADASHEIIENGSLIETDEAIYFVGISVPSFKSKEKDVISFSEEAPVFDKIKGKKVGDEVEIGENKMTIRTIY